MLCFYHGSDLDGHCSGAIINKKYGDVTLIPLSYGKYVSLDLVRGEVVYLIDFSIEPFAKMLELERKCEELIWIDHHSSAIKRAEQESFNPTGVRDENKSACELTWEWCFPGEEVPLAVTLLGKYDTWHHDWSADVLPFQYGMRAKHTIPGDPLWDVIFDNFIGDLITAGKNIMEYVTTDNSRYINAFSFETIFEGYSCICCNRGLVDSRIFDDVWDPKIHDLMVTFCRSNNKWLIHLYTNRVGINCGEIAKKYGGGGHRKAAGFRRKELPFKI
jgi:oligoribonuclease NrnB/cAMP/cGMP phosphodiesterase (DHH superfamily)